MTTDVDPETRSPRRRITGRPPWGRPAEPEPLFRFPTPDDPGPGTWRVLVMSLYAAALGLAGVGVGLRGLVSVLGGVPGWYVPLLVLMGLGSVVLAIAALMSVHRPTLPWTLLLAAAVPLAGDIALAVTY